MLAGAPARMGANLGTADATTFEAGIGGWNAGDQVSAVAASATVAHQGTNSLRFTRNNVAGTYLGTTSSGFPCAASTAYVFQFWFYTTVSSVVIKVDFDYYQTNGTTYVDSLLSAVGNTTLVASTWNLLTTAIFTTPALTGFIRPIPTHVSGLANGNFLYMDDLYLGQLLNPVGPPPPPRQAIMRAASR